MNRANSIAASFLLILVFTAGGTAAADVLDAIGNYNEGVDLAYEGKLTEALEKIDQALMESENFTLALVTRAGILNALGRYQESLEASDRALGLDPENAAAWNNRADALIGLGRYAEALIAAEKAAELDPLLTNAWVNKGTALNALRRYQEAVEASDRALALDPSSKGAQKNRETGIKGTVTGSPTQAPFPVPVLLCAAGLAAFMVWRRTRK